MNDITIKGNGSFVRINYVIIPLVLIPMDLAIIFSFTFFNELSIYEQIILLIWMFWINIYCIMSINYVKNIKVAFKEDSLMLSTLKPKVYKKKKITLFKVGKRKFYIKVRPWYIFTAGFEMRCSRPSYILVPSTSEILYKDILEYGYVKDLKIKRPYIYGSDLAIVTEKHKYFISDDQFSKKQVSEILEILNKKIKQDKSA